MSRILNPAIIAYSLSSVVPAQESKPEVFVQLGHAGVVYSVAFSQDGRSALSGSADKTLKLWEVASGRDIRTFEGHSSGVVSVAFSPDGRTALSGSADKTLKLWEVASGREVRTFKGHAESVKSVAISPNGRHALSGSNDKTLMLWDITSGREIRTFVGHSNDVTSVTFSPNGRYALSGSDDKTLKLWDISGGREIRTFIGHSASVNSVVFSPDGRTALSGAGDLLVGRVKLWDLSSGREIRTFEGHATAVASVAFSPAGRTALSWSTDGTLKIWEVSSGRESLLRGHAHSVHSVVISIDGRYALSVLDSRHAMAIGPDKFLKVWDLSSGREIRVFKGHLGDVNSRAFSPDGRYILSAGRWDGALKLWEVASGSEIRPFEGDPDGVTSVAFSPDGRTALSGSRDNTVKLWDISSGREIRSFNGHKDHITLVAYSPDGRTALSGSKDKTLKLWEITKSRAIRTFKGHKGSIYSVAFSSDGKFIVSGSWDKTLKLWDLTKYRAIRTFEGHRVPINFVASSPEGKFILSGSKNSSLKLWEVSSGQESRTFTKHVTSAAFSPDGRYILSAGSFDETLKLWEVASGSNIRIFEGHSGWVSSVTFSPDGRYAVSGSIDGTIRIWDVETGEEIVKLVSFTDGEWVSITPEGYYDASPNGAKHLNVRVGNEVYSMDNYAETFFRPDLVQLALAGESLAGFATLDDIKPAPGVAFVNTPAKTDKNELDVTLEITDAGGGIGKVRLYLNGVAVLTDGGRGMKRQTGERRSYRLKLTDGENRLQAIVFNADNTMESNPARHTVMADLGKERHDLYALVIGINEYANPTLSLKYAVPDALLFETSLQTATAGLFDRVEITRLTSATETTRSRIVTALESMQKLGPADTFVFYVASHGLVDDGAYYMITSNVGSLSTRKLKETALAQRELQDLLINVPAGKKMILFDTCNSGAMGTSLQVATLTRGLSETTAMKLLSRAVGSTVISASSSTQEALEGYKGHGLFTYVLSQGITGKADANRDGFVKTRELADYVEDEVTEIAEREFQRAQYPTTTPTGDAFPIARTERQ